LVVSGEAHKLVVTGGAEQQVAMAVQPCPAREEGGAFVEGGVGGFVAFEAKQLHPPVVVATEQAAGQESAVSRKSNQTEKGAGEGWAHPKHTRQYIESQ
jgi:hypothetical protein